MLHVGSSVLGGIGSKGFLLWVEVAVVSDERNEGGRERKKDRESDDFEERGERVMFFFFFWLNENRGFRGEMDV